MRFLFHSAPLLDLSFEVMLAGCRLGSHSVSDRSKMEQLLELLATRFFKLDFSKIYSRSKQLTGVTDSDLILILKGPQAYYLAKQQGYKFTEPEVP